MQNRILIDSGPLIALFDNDDNHHRAVKGFLLKHSYRFITTLAVFTEVSHMLNFNVKTQLDFYRWTMDKGVIISDINQNDIPRILELTEKYADLPIDFADATLLVTAEKTGIKDIISLDKDFYIYRFSGHNRLNNVYC